MKENKDKSWKEHINDYILKLSSTQLGQTDFDPNKEYSSEEPPVNLKMFGLILLIMAVIIAVAAGIMLLFTKVPYSIAITVLAVTAIICTIVIMRFRR